VAFSPATSASRGSKSRKFPVFSLMIREFDAESILHQTASSANQSTIFAFAAENWEIGRMFARFLRPEGTGEA